MIAITISNSMSVKPDLLLCVECFCMTIPSNGKQRNHSIIEGADIEILLPQLSTWRVHKQNGLRGKSRNPLI